MTRTNQDAYDLLKNYYRLLLIEHDTASAVKFWTDETILHYSGAHLFSGKHVGVSWLSEVYRPVLKACGADVVKEELVSPLVGDADFGMSHYTERVTLADAGKELVIVRKTLYGFKNGKITSVRMFDEEPERVNEFFQENFPPTLAAVSAR